MLWEWVKSWHLPDKAHLGLGWWPAISKAEDPVGQELGVVGSPTTQPMIAPNNRAALTPTAERSPIARKEKPHSAVCEAWFLFCTPYGI